jgi:hypothetical protein
LSLEPLPILAGKQAGALTIDGYEMVSEETGNRKQEPAAQEMWDQVPRSQKA